MKPEESHFILKGVTTPSDELHYIFFSLWYAVLHLMEGPYFYFKLGLYTETPQMMCREGFWFSALKIYTREIASLQQSLSFHMPT